MTLDILYFSVNDEILNNIRIFADLKGYFQVMEILGDLYAMSNSCESFITNAINKEEY